MFSSKCSVVLKYNECVLCLCRVYILDLVTKGVKMFGHTGSGPGCFRDPAGLAVDRLPCSVSIFLQELHLSVLGTCWWRTARTTDCASMTPTADFLQRSGLNVHCSYLCGARIQLNIMEFMPRSNWTLLQRGQADSCWIKKMETYTC